ncbi:uncharacterized protein LOC135840772 [Planococcus citri]|uniref:uncharacterized protein LOC135840772 n=1 Tax=Planococcus citri TaxID=170843 RepID=UPI0031F9E5F8
MAFASVSLLAACVLGVFAIAHGNPIIAASTNEELSTQSNSYNEQSYTAVDNPYGPDYVSMDSSSGSSSSSNYEYDSNYLNTNGGLPLLSTGGSLIQQEQELQQEASSYSQQQLNNYSTLGGNTVQQFSASSQQQMEQAQQQSTSFVSY